MEQEAVPLHDCISMLKRLSGLKLGKKFRHPSEWKNPARGAYEVLRDWAERGHDAKQRAEALPNVSYVAHYLS
jgi:hypothetical protein